MTKNQELWLLAQLKPQAHEIAVRNLNRQGFRTFLPTHEVTRTRNGRFVTSWQPLFPGYLFIRSYGEPAMPRKINSTLGVNRLVCLGEIPAEVPSDFVAALMARCNASGQLTESPDPTVGEKITLLTGPFADFVATVEQVDASKRIWVLIELMGRTTRLALSSGQWRMT